MRVKQMLYLLGEKMLSTSEICIIILVLIVLLCYLIIKIKVIIINNKIDIYIMDNLKEIYSKLDDDQIQSEMVIDRVSEFLSNLTIMMKKHNIKKFKYLNYDIKLNTMGTFQEELLEDFFEKKSEIFSFKDEDQNNLVYSQFENEEICLILENYTKKFGIDYNGIEKEYLMRILKGKGFDFHNEELDDILDDFIYYNEKKKTLELMMKINGFDSNDFLENIIKNFGEKYYAVLPIIKNTIKNRYNVIYSEEEIVSKCDLLIDKVNLHYFEKKLMENTYSIHHMSGYDFEDYLADIFKSKNYSVQITQRSQDQGADIILEKLGKRIVIQAKKYSNKVGNKAVQEIVSAMKYYKADLGSVITNNLFTKQAKSLALANEIILVDGFILKKIIEEQLYDPYIYKNITTAST